MPRACPRLGDIGRCARLGVLPKENRFGMPGGEILAAIGGACLEQEWRPLRRGVGEMDGVDLEMRTVVMNFADVVRIRDHALDGVDDNGLVVPAAFQSA